MILLMPRLMPRRTHDRHQHATATGRSRFPSWGSPGCAAHPPVNGTHSSLARPPLHARSAAWLAFRPAASFRSKMGRVVASTSMQSALSSPDTKRISSVEAKWQATRSKCSSFCSSREEGEATGVATCKFRYAPLRRSTCKAQGWRGTLHRFGFTAAHACWVRSAPPSCHVTHQAVVLNEFGVGGDEVSPPVLVGPTKHKRQELHLLRA